MLLKLLFVAVGGSFGALARYGLSGWASRISDHLPYGTLAVNVIGSFLIGLVLSYSLYSHEINPYWRVLLTTGFLGAFTTFSTLSYETLELLAEGSIGLAGLNITLNLAFGLAAVWLGSTIGKII